MTYIVDDNLFDEAFIEIFDDYCTESVPWTYGRKSALNKDNLIWGSTLYEQGGHRNFFAEYILAKFSKKHQLQFEMMSCVLNGQTKDQQTCWHVDLYSEAFDIDKKYTLVYYVNKRWDDSSGQTEIKLPDGQITVINFVPGKVVCFPSKYQHFGAPPYSNNVLRITCALKLTLLGKIK